MISWCKQNQSPTLKTEVRKTKRQFRHLYGDNVYMLSDQPFAYLRRWPLYNLNLPEKVQNLRQQHKKVNTKKRKTCITTSERPLKPVL